MTIENGPPALSVSPAGDADVELLGRLLQLYLYDFSEHAGFDVDDRGAYHYAWLDAYRTEPERHAYVFRAGPHPAGFALVRAGEPTEMAEFFVLRKCRRSGLGSRAAGEVFRRHSGPWTIRQVATNRSAMSFWRRAIPVPFEELVGEDGSVEQRFTVDATARPDVAGA